MKRPCQHSERNLFVKKIDKNLFSYFTGQEYTSGSTTHVTASSGPQAFLQPMPKKSYIQEVYKRIYHNLPYITKAKGTERGLRALINCYGVPSDILTINIDGDVDREQNVYLSPSEHITGSLDREYTITVDNPGAGNRYYIDGVLQETLTLLRGHTYTFNQSDSTNSTHPIRLSTTSDGEHNSGDQYTNGWSDNGGTLGTDLKYTLLVSQTAPDTLYYYCGNHPNMGGSIDIEDKALTSLDRVTVDITGSLAEGDALLANKTIRRKIYKRSPGRHTLEVGFSPSDNINTQIHLSLIHISEPTRLLSIAVGGVGV